MELTAQPKNTHAIVVGVEQYAYGPRWNLDGPASDAIRVVEWLRSREVPANNIRLFWAPIHLSKGLGSESSKTLEERVQQAGLQPRDATLDVIFNAISNEVPVSCELLFFFWGGHGVIDGDERRVFCADATQATKQNLNLNSLLLYMHSSPYKAVRRQVVIVDSCANYFMELRSVAGLPRHDFPVNPPDAQIQQFVLFSTGPGQYAINKSSRKTGAFSEQLLAVFESVTTAWPDMDEAYHKVREYFGNVPGAQRPTYMRVTDWVGNEDRIGSVQTGSDSQRISTAKSFAQVLDAVPDVLVSALSRVPLVGMPPVVDEFVGRHQLLQALDKDWESADCCISVVFGLGGEGTTTAVRRWVEERRKHTSADAMPIVFWWTFNQQFDADRFFEAAISFFLPESVGSTYRERRGELLAELMHRGRYLVVLDGMEVLQYSQNKSWARLANSDIREFLYSFASGQHESHCVITSQMPMLDLNNYLVVADHEIEPLTKEEGRKLFERLGIQESGNLGAPTLQDLAEQCGGHPLTIAVLGAYIVAKGGSAADGVELLTNITAHDHDDDRLHNLLRSYDNRLDNAEREFLTICSAFRQPITKLAVSSIFHTSIGNGYLNRNLASLSDADLNKLVERLVQYRLLSAASDPTTHSLHPLIRSHYALRLARAPSQNKHALHRMIRDYYLSVAGQETAVSRSLRLLVPLIEAVHHSCEAGEFQEASNTFWNHIVGPQPATQNALVHRLGALATDLALVSEFFPAGDLNAEPLVFNNRHRNWLVNEVGICKIALGNPREAIRYLERAANDAVNNELWNEAATTFANHAAVKCFLGELGAAMSDATRANDYATRLSQLDQKQALIVHVRALQGWIAHRMGNLEDAGKFFVEAGLTETQLRPLWPSPVDWIHYADFLVSIGTFERAREIALETQVLAQTDHRVPLQSMTHRLLGDLDKYAADLKSASEHYQNAIQTARLTSRWEVLIEALLAGGRFALDRSDWQMGIDRISEALKLSGENGYRPYEAEARLALAQVLDKRDKTNDARAELRRVQELLEQTGYVPVKDLKRKQIHFQSG